jgi:hypothetical protein
MSPAATTTQSVLSEEGSVARVTSQPGPRVALVTSKGHYSLWEASLCETEI